MLRPSHQKLIKLIGKARLTLIFTLFKDFACFFNFTLVEVQKTCLVPSDLNFDPFDIWNKII
jgi:hypothetical protein